MIDDKVVAFKVLLSELAIVKRKVEVEKIREVLSPPPEQVVNH